MSPTLHDRMMTGLILFRSYAAVSSIIQQLWPDQKSVACTAPHLLSQALNILSALSFMMFPEPWRGWGT